MKDPVDHILRPPLPWRVEVAITECGYNAAKVQTLTREAWIARVKDLGQQRAAMITCMTCSQTAANWSTWDEDPRSAVRREIEWEGTGRWRNREHGELLRDELLAIADLIAAHREEFEEHLSTAAQVRAWNEKKAANQAAKKQTDGRKMPW